MIIKKSLHGHQTSNFYFIAYIDSGKMVKYCSVLPCCLLMVHKTLFLGHCPGPVLKMHEWLPCAQFQFLCPAWDIYWSLECKPKKRLTLEDLDWLHREKPSVVQTHILLNYKQTSLYNPSCKGPTTVTALCKSQNWRPRPAILTKQ